MITSGKRGMKSGTTSRVATIRVTITASSTGDCGEQRRHDTKARFGGLASAGSVNGPHRR
jgi:hypothetical protein